MFDILIDSDFKDFYDHELCSPPGFFKKKIKRLSNELNLLEQLALLRKAGIKTAYAASFFTLYAETKNSHSSNDPDWEKKHFISTLNGENLTFSEAKEKIKNLEELVFYSGDEKDSNSVYKYIQIGSNGFWGHYRTTLNGHRLFSLISKNKKIPSVSIARINRPLFSIDFKLNKKELEATNIDVSPNLKELGFDKILKAEEIAELLLPSLEMQNQQNSAYI